MWNVFFKSVMWLYMQHKAGVEMCIFIWVLSEMNV